VPGFFVGGVFLALAAGGEEEVAAEGDYYFGGEDVPDVFGDDVDGEEVDLAAGVGALAAGLDSDDVSAALASCGGLDLDAEEMAVAFDGDVVAGGVSPRLGDVEAALGDAGHEDEFGPLAAMFWVFDDDAAAAKELCAFVGDDSSGAVLAFRFSVTHCRARRFLVTHSLVTHWIRPQNTKGASLEAAPLVPFGNFVSISILSIWAR
jgi:hypothetical protein